MYSVVHDVLIEKVKKFVDNMIIPLQSGSVFYECAKLTACYTSTVLYLQLMVVKQHD